ncbi:MAG: TIGR02996 domain-containing protein [Planctomycetes bacterium]|nr:TIGR02996 domain-containing protein [Planctomycetota bacterium]
MSDRDALLAAILANPDEDTPRLMYADWLDEHGDPARAEFVRVQCELARLEDAEADLPESFGTSCAGGGQPWPVCWLPHYTEDRLALLNKQSELLNAHSDEWRKGLPKYADNSHTNSALRFRRGFVGHVMVSLGPLVKGAAALWKNHPVESIRLERPGGEARLKLSKCKPLAAVRKLELRENGYERDLLVPFANCEYLSNVRKLDLGYAELGGSAVAALEAARMRPLDFHLGVFALTEGAFTALLHSPFVLRLRRFRPYRLPEWGPAVIASAHLPDLRLLDLSSNRAGDAGVRALTKSNWLNQLVTLDLSYSNLTDEACDTLAAWPGLASIRSLNLGDNHEITGRGVAALLKSKHLKPIHLGLRWTACGDAGAKALAKWPGLANLIDLDLSYAQVADAGVLAFAGSSRWRDIRYLKLSGSAKIDEAASAKLRARVGGRKIDIWGY